MSKRFLHSAHYETSLDLHDLDKNAALSTSSSFSGRRTLPKLVTSHRNPVPGVYRGRIKYREIVLNELYRVHGNCSKLMEYPQKYLKALNVFLNLVYPRISSTIFFVFEEKMYVLMAKLIELRGRKPFSIRKYYDRRK